MTTPSPRWRSRRPSGVPEEPSPPSTTPPTSRPWTRSTKGALPFLGIVDTVQRVVDAHDAPDALTVESLAAAEDWARRKADQLIAAT